MFSAIISGALNGACQATGGYGLPTAVPSKGSSAAKTNAAAQGILNPSGHSNASASPESTGAAIGMLAGMVKITVYNTDCFSNNGNGNANAGSNNNGNPIQAPAPAPAPATAPQPK